MRTFSSSYIFLKNQVEGTTWFHLLELMVNANSTAYFTTSIDTLTWNGHTYAPVPLTISPEQQSAQGELPSIYVDVSNYTGQPFRFARDNDLSLNDVTIRLINSTLINSGDDARIKMQILGAVFTKDAARFNLGWNFNYDAEGPKRVWNRRDFPSIAFAQANWAII